ncbi:MAG: PDZ domain-containing protein [Chloroflexi bacterium]|jgi:glutaredoxin 3|nr:PDZ domain-containing protein [Chloroflexota bacterium]MBT7081267.1 PDZ domain-containing protein [Chloroflexota bacterium]MBT7288898.1 PDZ domain-containing protein [Chloroflexota bacterium]
MSVVLYTSPTCGYCHQAKAYLAQKGVRYTERDISADAQAGVEIMKLTGQTGVPVIVVNGQPIIGFNRPALDQALAAAASSKKPRFGIKIADADKTAQKAGALVGHVQQGLPGQNAGLMQGDIITELNTQSITNAADLAKALGALESGSKVSIGFIRGTDNIKSETTV